MENESGIYIIRSQVKPERYYIGSAANFKRRWGAHVLSLKKNIHHSLKMQRHCNKYGLNDLIFEALVYCDKPSLIKTEQGFLNICNPYFNECRFAGSMLGYKHSKETIEKMRGRKPSGETRRRISDAVKNMSDETRRKMSEAKKGTHRTEETKEKLSKANKGRKRSDEVRRKISEAAKGRCGTRLGVRLSEETKLKMSKAAKGRPKSKEHKEKLSQALMGNKNHKKAA